MQSQADYSTIFTICQSFSRDILDEKGNLPRRGPVPRASDLEIIALSLYQSLLSIESESFFFHQISSTLPDLAQRIGTRRNYNGRRKSLAGICERLRSKMVEEMAKDNPEKIFIVDSMPLETCRLARAYFSRACRERFDSNPNYGYCASQKQHYFGYKFHAICSPNGVIEHYELTPANISDIRFLPEVKELFQDCLLIGDGGYLNRDMAMELFEYAGIELMVPYRCNMDANQPLPRGFGRTRRRVEVVFSQLVDQLCIRKNYAKRQTGLFARIIAKVTIFTLLQYENFRNERPISQIRYTFAA